MLARYHNLFEHYDGPAPDETLAIERDGHCLVRGVLSRSEVDTLRDEVLAVYQAHPGADRENVPSDQAAVFRYQMVSRSALCQRVAAHPRILDIVEPLVGDDCHLINSTAWRNPPGEVAEPRDYYWHVDSGPQVPRPAGVEWPDSIPYPIFVVATHLYLQDCTLDDGPTTVVPTSHRSGQFPPPDCRFDAYLEYRGHPPVRHVAEAGDVGFFVSDVWHRRSLPTTRSQGRFFLQHNYGRRDIAQRLLPVADSAQVSLEAQERAITDRERILIGLHPAGFYDG
jgi:ectoine hydroxylase-related dioxygenase (phytanoyl-CoA dioxygenase family)